MAKLRVGGGFPAAPCGSGAGSRVPSLRTPETVSEEGLLWEAAREKAVNLPTLTLPQSRTGGLPGECTVQLSPGPDG